MRKKTSAQTRKKISRSLKQRALLLGGGAGLLTAGVGAGYLIDKRRRNNSSSSPSYNDHVKGSGVPRERRLPGKYAGATPADHRWTKNFIADNPDITPGVVGRFRKKGKDPYSPPVKKKLRIRVEREKSRPVLNLPSSNTQSYKRKRKRK